MNANDNNLPPQPQPASPPNADYYRRLFEQQQRALQGGAFPLTAPDTVQATWVKGFWDNEQSKTQGKTEIEKTRIQYTPPPPPASSQTLAAVQPSLPQREIDWEKVVKFGVAICGLVVAVIGVAAAIRSGRKGR